MNASLAFRSVPSTPLYMYVYLVGFEEAGLISFDFDSEVLQSAGGQAGLHGNEPRIGHLAIWLRSFCSGYLFADEFSF